MTFGCIRFSFVHLSTDALSWHCTVGSRSRGMKSFVFEPDRGVVMEENNVLDNLFEVRGHLGHLGTPQESPKGLQVAICGVFWTSCF